MRYKAEGCIVPVDGEPDVAYVVTPITKWYEADSHFEAAAMLVLDHPEINCSDIWVVDELYQMGLYPLEQVKWKADYLCGLRWYPDE
jgi:hypothetical protein